MTIYYYAFHLQTCVLLQCLHRTHNSHVRLCLWYFVQLEIDEYKQDLFSYLSCVYRNERTDGWIILNSTCTPPTECFIVIYRASPHFAIYLRNAVDLKEEESGIERRMYTWDNNLQHLLRLLMDIAVLIFPLSNGEPSYSIALKLKELDHFCLCTWNKGQWQKQLFDSFMRTWTSLSSSVNWPSQQFNNLSRDAFGFVAALN